MKCVALHNLGCKVNAYEMDVMQQMLQEKGYTIVPFDEIADIYIVNTCTVTNIADRKSRQMLHQAKKRNPNAVVVAVGCYVQTGKEDILADAGVDLAVGNNRKKDLAAILEQFLNERDSENKTLHDTSVIDINHTYEYEEMRLSKTAEHTRAYIKIQDGCNQFCTYCAIPYARGRVRSRKPENILEEIRGLVAAGYQEFVLTGIHISSYGIDFSENGEQEFSDSGMLKYTSRSKLLDLICMIDKIEGVKRLRLGSLEPRIVTEQFARTLRECSSICPHFHLSLQSGCDATLQRMNRHYTTREYSEGVQWLRTVYENPAITTDVIAGFPGETEEEFEQTRQFLQDISFYEMHIFKYSRRNGTKAAEMKGQVPDKIKTERSAQLLKLESEQSRRYRESYLNRSVEVLIEETVQIGDEMYQLGHTREYVKVAVKEQEPLSNHIVTVVPESFLQDDILYGTVQ